MVSPSNTVASLTEPGSPDNYPGYLRTSWNDNKQGERAAQYARNILGVTSAATINDGSGYSAGLVGTFADEFTSLGGTITRQETIDPGQTDMSVPLANIAADSPDLIYMPVFMDAGGHLIDQARGTTGLETATLMGADGLFTADLETIAGADIEGFLVTNVDSSLFSAGYATNFIPAFNAKFGHDPETIFSAYAYDAFMMVKAAIEQVAVVKPDGSLQIGRQALRNALYGTSNLPGLTGTLTCSATGDCADSDVLAVFEYHFGAFPPTRVWP
jgi:branched-chain amino acid transport system substrate-binding protein